MAVLNKPLKIGNEYWGAKFCNSASGIQLWGRKEAFIGNSLGYFQGGTISSLSLRNFAEGHEFLSALFLFVYLT